MSIRERFPHAWLYVHEIQVNFFFHLLVDRWGLSHFAHVRSCFFIGEAGGVGARVWLADVLSCAVRSPVGSRSTVLEHNGLSYDICKKHSMCYAPSCIYCRSCTERHLCYRYTRTGFGCLKGKKKGGVHNGVDDILIHPLT